MALRLILLTFLVVAMVAIPTGEAQLGGLGGLGGLISGLLGILNIQGVVHCAVDSNNMGSNVPVFPNAQVQLRYGNGKVISTTTTNERGAFAFPLDLTQQLATLVNNCNVVVTTPLSTCNENLPSTGVLQSPLKYVGSTIVGVLNLFNLLATQFQFIPGVNN